METTKIKKLIKEEIVQIIKTDREVYNLIVQIAEPRYAPKQKTEDRFDKMIQELREERIRNTKIMEAQDKKWEEWRQEWKEYREKDDEKWKKWRQEWEEYREEQNRKSEKQDKKWEKYREEQNRKSEKQDKKWEEYKKKDDEKWKKWRQEWEEYREEQNRKSEKQDKKWEEYREEQNRKSEKQDKKWEEYREEQNRKSEKQDKKWEEYKKKDDEKWRKWQQEWKEYREEEKKKWEKQEQKDEKLHQEVMMAYEKFDASLGALGARWGLHSEDAFRNGLRAILSETFDVQVLNVTEWDKDGYVFGRADQVEIDVIVKNGMLILCEIKSSVSKPEIYTFIRKAEFYEKLHNSKADRKIVITPMLDKRAKKVADNNGIECYSHSREVKP